MELNNSKLIFEVICGDRNLIVEVIKKYNQTNNTDFHVIKFEESDGVMFAIISVSSYQISDIFHFGSLFGSTMQYKRERKEIDW